VAAPREPVSNFGIAGAPSAAPSAPEAPVEMAAPSDARMLGSSPMQAIEQVVTAQALLVSLLLTPFSKDGAEQPVARMDAGSVNARPVDAARARTNSPAR
jgi:hypothetical protein